ncbi:secondary thiamine-phosphate synthase enzyme YjbQ [Chlamydiota bacterium]
MSVCHGSITVQAEGYCDIIDITRDVERIAKNSRIKNGIVTTFVPGSTGGITTIEYESGVLSDLRQAIERLLPQQISYSHDVRWGDGNGFSHVRAALLGASLSIPLKEGTIVRGTWQQIVFIDFDNCPRNRKLAVTVVGE